MFSDLKHADLKLSPIQIEECFILSQMTVVDEVENMEKYEYVYFVEWLEFICRIAIVGITMQDALEYKVQLLLEILFDISYKKGIMEKAYYPLREVDEKYKYDDD